MFDLDALVLASYLAVSSKLAVYAYKTYRDLYRFWLKIFAVAFGMGVVSGEASYGCPLPRFGTTIVVAARWRLRPGKMPASVEARHAQAKAQQCARQRGRRHG